MSQKRYISTPVYLLRSRKIKIHSLCFISCHTDIDLSRDTTTYNFNKSQKSMVFVTTLSGRLIEDIFTHFKGNPMIHHLNDQIFRIRRRRIDLERFINDYSTTVKYEKTAYTLKVNISVEVGVNHKLLKFYKRLV